MAKKSSSQVSRRQKKYKKPSSESSTPTAEQKIFQPVNYILMISGALIVGIGYLLMTGGRQEMAEFNYDEIYSFRRITLAPIVIIIGFVMTIVAILWKPKRAIEEETTKNS